MSWSESDLKRVVREVIKEGQTRPEESHVDHVVGCKDCYEGVIKKAKETSKYRCKDCHLPLLDDMVGAFTPSCPLCGSDQAEVNERE